ncbi:hypothetical protein [uncultured Polaribacter sp.]|uniref:hypothetical protein n=1 Tax=uncultured Polaribacter sp. TaxID=174711 RepID=UPI0026107386|nr:hypothetical protein [uncultured Polaribacter sp.]
MSCSSNDDDNLDSVNFINPPKWILGTWLDKSEPAWAQIGGFKFTNDNLFDLSSNGTITINLKEGLKQGIDAGVISVNENSTSTSYSLEIVSSGAISSSYEFSKGNNNASIVYKLTATRNVILTKQ